MSRSDRDRRGRPHSEKRCPEAQGGGCSYCITGEWKRLARRQSRHTTKTELRTVTKGTMQ